MKGFIANIEQLTLENETFRTVLYTGKHSQLVVMSISAGEDIGEETHHLDQFIRVEEGDGVAILDGKETTITDGTVIIVPAGTKHNIVNRSSHEALKLYTLYAPPEHKDKTVHQTKAEAMAREEHFDGVTTE